MCWFCFCCSKYDFNALPPEDDEDYIDMGGAILNFYAGLVDLLGRCAPDAETIKSGRSDSNVNIKLYINQIYVNTIIHREFTLRKSQIKYIC